MVWLHRGLCGLDFKKQTNAIGILYLLFCFLALVYGFVIISNPATIVDPSFFPSDTTEHPNNLEGEEGSAGSNNETSSGNFTISETKTTLPTTTTTTNATFSGNEFDVEKSEEISVARDSESAERIEDGETASDERKLYDSLLRQVQNKGMEMIIGSIISMVLGVLLILGSRQDKSIFFVPWLTEQTTGLIVIAIVGLSKLIGGRLQTSAGFVVLFMLLFVLFAFFTYAVMSHFMMLRKMKQHSRDIINSVMQGSGYQTGVNYDRLRDELGQARELQEVGPTSLTTGPENKDKRDDLLYFSI